MPLFRDELPEIGKPFVAIPEDGDGRNCDIYIRFTDGEFVGSMQDNLFKVDMRAEYREWVYCQTRPYFEQKAEQQEADADYETRRNTY